ncbi:hypothetical protein KOEU_33040 [Komagataeibacter europaeus]|uniref:Prevent-host-death protein n=1 Tax=Komagataeibacter europaeus TaxID=33995 RepID=A0A0M0ED68_KOMEU|nr:hypothetical protein KOEU_38590 [Komagataeibacter europaeus]KON63180.1 hypothetical protein KOEU_33040 [Komagataeibacter europaeus]
MSQHLSDNASSPQKIGVREFRGNLTAYLRQVRQGSTILVTSHDQVVAELRPPASSYGNPPIFSRALNENSGSCF